MDATAVWICSEKYWSDKVRNEDILHLCP